MLQCLIVHHESTRTDLGLNWEPCEERTANDRLSHGAVLNA